MASEHEQYPGLEHIRNGASAETQHLLDLLDEMERKRWRVNDELIKAVDAYIDEEAKRKAAEQQLAQAQQETERVRGLAEKHLFDKAKIEGELAQERLANEMLRKDKLNAERQLGDLEGYNAQVEAQNAAMRALLERTVTIFSVIVDVGIRNANQHLENIRAFLAQHKEQSDA